MLQNGKLRFGINIPQMSPTGEFDPSIVSEFLPKVESLGYDSAWSLELVFTAMPMIYPIPLLSYAAAFRQPHKTGHIHYGDDDTEPSPSGQRRGLPRPVM